MSSNEQSNHEAQGFGFNPFTYGTGKAQDMRSFDEILKEFEDFFKMEENRDAKIDGIKGRDIHREIEIDFQTSVEGSSQTISFPRKETTQAIHVEEVVKIPKGVFDGLHLRMKGKGN